MQINRNNNYQQNTSFGMIRLPLEKDGQAIKYARNRQFPQIIADLKDRGLVKVGRDKSFNLVEYVTTRFNSETEKEILQSLHDNSRRKIKTVNQIAGMGDIKRQSIFKKLCDLKKTKREDFPAKFDKVFPDAFK